MKTNILLALSAALATIGAFAADSQWTYNSTAGTISDGDWTFAATVSGTDLTVGAVSVDPGEGATLDFSKSVTDGSATYTIVTLNPNFAAYANKANLATLVLPTAWLVTISDSAFDGCTSLQNVTNYVPDSVKAIGKYAFRQVPAGGDLRLNSVADANAFTFAESGIESVYFGPGFKKFAQGHWQNGTFRYCASLTNIVFDAGITYAEWTAQHVFLGDAAIKTTVIDLSGFKKLDANWGLFPGPEVKEVVLGAGLSVLSANAFGQFGSLSKVTFAGAPPSTFGTPIYQNTAAAKALVTYVPEAYSNEWSVYAADGIVNDFSSTFSTNYFAASIVPYRPLLFPPSGGMAGELGDGVVEDGVLTLPGGWRFNVTMIGAELIVGSCIAAPATISELDLSVRITDTLGHDLSIFAINTQFGTCAVTFVNNVPQYSYSCNTGGEMVGSVVFPASGLLDIQASAFACCTNLAGPLHLPDGLLTIGNYAFAGCTSLSKIENYVPDTVTAVGDYAFVQVPAGGELRLSAVVNAKVLTFAKSGIESVYFGPGFKKFDQGNWPNGTFRDCASLTNIVFDAGITNAEWTAQHVFLGDAAIKNRTLDLSGFKTIDTSWGMFTSASVGEVTLGAGLLTFHGDSLQGFSSLTNVVFEGVPPKSFTTPYLKSSSASKLIVTRVHKKCISAANAAGKCWLDYSANGQVNGKKPTSSQATTFAAQYLASGVDPAMRPLVTLEPDMGLSIFVR